MLAIRTALSAALRHYPFFSGYAKIALSKPLAAFARNEQFAVITLRNGAKLLVRGKDHCGRILMYMGDLEPIITYAVQRLLKPGDTVLDIGANLGWFSMTAAPIVGTSGSVHAFEPQTKLVPLIAASVTMNEFSQVHLHDFALSDTNGTATLHVLKGNSGAGRLTEEVSDEWEQVVVKLRHAGEVLDSLSLSKVRMLKIDVEGHEATVFGAARKTLEKTLPEVVIFESLTTSESTQLLDRPVVKILAEMGYRIFSLDHSATKPKVTECKPGAHYSGIDFIALLKSEQGDRDLFTLLS